MNCPICGNELRPGKKDPSYGLCDNCRKKFKLPEASSNSDVTTASEPEEEPVQSSDKPVKKSSQGSDKPIKKSSSGSDKPRKKSNSGSGKPKKKSSSDSDKPKKKNSQRSDKPVKSKAKTQTDYFPDEMDTDTPKKGGCLKFIIIGIIILLLGAAGLFFGKDIIKEKFFKIEISADAKNDKKGSEGSASADNDKNHYSLGDTAEIGDLQVTFKNTSTSTGNETIIPGDGKTFLICELEITNNSDEEISISSQMDIEAYCDDYLVSEDLSGLSLPEAEGKNEFNGSVTPGASLDGILIYQVPENFSTFELMIAPDFWSGEAVKFFIQK